MGYNGGAVVAMTGKDCVAIASDLRYGIRQLTLASNMPKVPSRSRTVLLTRGDSVVFKVFRINERTFVGLSGLATDVQTMFEKLQFRVNLYQLREEREMEPKTFAHMVSTVLYERRCVGALVHLLPRDPSRANASFGPYFVEPVIAGLDKDNKPYICAMDLIGAPLLTDDFVLAGTCSENLYGTCESLYKPNLVRLRLSTG